MKYQPAIINSGSDRVYPDLDMALPESMPVSVILESKPSVSPWRDLAWRVISVSIISNTAQSNNKLQSIYSDKEKSQYIYPGLKVSLFKDECESYFHNLSSPTPRCYVIAHQDDDESAPKPFLITMSFDEAHAYLEGDDEIYDVDVPPELYRWTEAFLLINYAPEKRHKRKRDNWKDNQQDSGQE